MAIFRNPPQEYIRLRGISLTLQFGPSFAEVRQRATWACLSARHTGVSKTTFYPSEPSSAVGSEETSVSGAVPQRSPGARHPEMPLVLLHSVTALGRTHAGGGLQGRAQREQTQAGSRQESSRDGAPALHKAPQSDPRGPKTWSSTDAGGALGVAQGGGGADSRKRLVKNKPPPQRPVPCAPHQAILPRLAQWPDLFLLILQIGVFSLKRPSSCFLDAHPSQRPSVLPSSATQQGDTPMMSWEECARGVLGSRFPYPAGHRARQVSSRGRSRSAAPSHLSCCLSSAFTPPPPSTCAAA